ncbi:helicase-exonuclease AddAB subunit AddA [Aerococcaceae bacterium NML160702]|nr:helicase-exonuclease AddAB subunit AddA [Aerococcaceae bacterium NML160702]
MNFPIPPKPIEATYNDEQWQAIHQKGTNILVAASAGSGKTTVLIERILMHLLQGYAQVDELLVCTFTEAAANEMKQRMEARLKKELNQTANREAQQLLLQQLRLLPTAHIRTLHSFCLQVIQQYFYLVDFDPNFRLLTDDTQKELLYQEVWNDLVEEIFEGKQQLVTEDVFLSLLGQYTDSRNDHPLYELVLHLHLFASSHPEPDLWLKHLNDCSRDFANFETSSLYKQVLKPYLIANCLSAYKILQTTLQAVRSLSEDTVAKYEPFLQREANQVAQVLEACQADAIAELVTLSNTLTFERWPSNSKKSDDYEAVIALKEERDYAKELLNHIATLFDYDYATTVAIEKRVTPTLAAIGQLTRAFRQQLANKKAQLNVIDYNDLEHLTLDILAPYSEVSGKREASPAAYYFQQQFKEVLVDEYQDINEIQATILAWLAHEHRPELAGNLFMVGDVKQSIYGFRMAEPSLFLAKYQAYGAHQGGELIILDKNYRSRDEVLQFTNLVFERLMDTQFGEMTYGKQESLKTGNLSFLPNAPSEQFNIDFLIHVKETYESEVMSEEQGENGQFDTSIEFESHLIAQDIQHKIANQYPIYDKFLKKTRPVEYRDFVILTATRQPFLPVQQIFEQYQLPIYSQKVENYFQRQEIRLMLALLKLIDNPLQDIPLVAILRSYFVGLDDEALSQIRIVQPDGLFYDACQQYLIAFEGQRDIQQTLHYFFQQLNHWRDLSQHVPLIQLIWTIYQETHFLDYVAGLSNGQQRQANLHAFYQRAEEFEQSTHKGVFGFVCYIEQMMQHENDLAEPVLLAEDQNVVRMMTVHASKGLEFPIVYLMNTQKAFNLMDTNRAYVPSKHYGLATDYFDTEQLLKYPSFVKKMFKLEKVNQLKAEEMRKLYVALTRCEQKLIIVGTLAKKETGEQLQARIRQLADDTTLVMNAQERQKAKSWLEWLLQATAQANKSSESSANFDLDQVTYTWKTQSDIYSQSQVTSQHYQRTGKEEWLKEVAQTLETPIVATPFVKGIEGLMQAKYDYPLATRTSSYQSVSELKRLYEEPQNQKLSHFQDRRPSHKQAKEQETTHIQSIRYTQDTFEAPIFLQQKQLDYAQIGTITHYFLQQLAFEPFVDITDAVAIENELRRQLTNLVADEYLTNEQAKVIELAMLTHFVQSELGQEVARNASNLKREQAFSYLLPAKWLFKQQLEASQITELGNDQLLIHGIIDNYIEYPDGIVILDYKTDRYKPYASLSRTAQKEAILEKYRFQISLYAQALSCAVGKPVKAAYLVLLDFDESLAVKNLYKFEEANSEIDKV